MLTRLALVAGGRPVQQFVSPCVYLDHWALLDASADADLGQRFSEQLARLDGTLVLSWVNVAEFCLARSEEEARNAELFIGRNLPRLFFLAPDPFVLRARDDGLPVPEDKSLLEAVAALKPEAGRDFTATGLLTVMRGQLLETMDRWKSTFVDRINTVRAEYQVDPKVAAEADKIPNDSGTRLIVKELVRDYMSVLKRPVDANDALDFHHTVVPVTFCDWVLLDGPRIAQLERIEARLKAGGRPVKMPMRFSNKHGSGGVKRLVDELTKR